MSPILCSVATGTPRDFDVKGGLLDLSKGSTAASRSTPSGPARRHRSALRSRCKSGRVSRGCTDASGPESRWRRGHRALRAEAPLCRRWPRSTGYDVPAARPATVRGIPASRESNQPRWQSGGPGRRDYAGRPCSGYRRRVRPARERCFVLEPIPGGYTTNYDVPVSHVGAFVEEVAHEECWPEPVSGSGALREL